MELISFAASAWHPTSSSTHSSSSSSSIFGVSIIYRADISSLCGSSKRSWRISADFEQFNDRAMKAVTFAQREAKLFRDDMIGHQHLLLGLVTEDSSPEGFLDSGLSIVEARDAVCGVWHPEYDAETCLILQASVSSYKHIPRLSEDANQVLRTAVRLSEEIGHSVLLPEHIYISLVIDYEMWRLDAFKRLEKDDTKLFAVACKRLGREFSKHAIESSGPSSVSFQKFLRRVIVKMIKTKMWEKAFRRPHVSNENVKSALRQFCVDLTDQAGEGVIKPVTDGDSEVQRVSQILIQSSRNNPILVGESKMDKTALVEGLASSIARGLAPLDLLKKHVLSLDIGLLLAGADERGELLLRVTKLLKELITSGDVILFVDEIHTLFELSVVWEGYDGPSRSVADTLKPFIIKGQLQCIGSTTTDEYRIKFEKDEALVCKFQPFLVHESDQACQE